VGVGRGEGDERRERREEREKDALG